MTHEIERKFLVDRELWNKVKDFSEERKDIEQYYLINGQGFVLRLSVVNFKKASLGIKGGKKGITSVDLSYKIPINSVFPLIESVPHTRIHKKRYMYRYKGFMWEIDVFLDHNKGLIIAEIELPHEDTVFEKPDFILQEVSYTKGYSNFELSK
jgi:adenylate cyclase